MVNKIIGKKEMEIINLFQWSIWKDIENVEIFEEIRGIKYDRGKEHLGECRGQ